MSESKTKKIKISVDEKVLKSDGILVDSLKNDMELLSKTLKSKFLQIFPQNINHIGTLYSIVDLADIFRNIEKCDGFKEHVKKYNKKEFTSNFLVGLLASYLHDKVDDVILEPKIKTTDKNPHIYIKFKDEVAYLECKTIIAGKSEYLEAHKKMFDIISGYVNYPHQLSIQYSKKLTNREIHKLGKTISDKLSSVTSEGDIINNENIKVNVIPREENKNKKIPHMIIIPINSESTTEKCVYPGDIFFKNGLAIEISGPLVDFSKKLRERLKRARGQNDPNNPFVLVIDTNYMLGKLDENIRALKTAFQPNINTRFSGVLLLNHGRSFEKKYLKMTYISNPYTKHPISKDFKLILNTPEKNI